MKTEYDRLPNTVQDKDYWLQWQENVTLKLDEGTATEHTEEFKKGQEEVATICSHQDDGVVIEFSNGERAFVRYGTVNVISVA